MSKKKRFGISEALTRGLNETIHVVENNSNIFRNAILPLSRIELDPENPRKLAINLVDVRTGIHSSDPLYQRKQEELEKLRELSLTIQSSGVINPIVVFKLGEAYRVVAGERRCLASILADKHEIEARVFNEKPKSFELKLIQWIENTAREDLTLDERLDNIRDLIDEYRVQQGEVAVTATFLKNLTGLSLSQSTYYLAALNAPEDVDIEIKKGRIRSLDKAALLSTIVSQETRYDAIQACIQGSSLKEIRNLISKHKALQKNKTVLPPSRRGRQLTKINLGTTQHPDVIKTIIESVMQRHEFNHFTDVFSQVNWVDLRQTTKAFRKLIEVLELEMT